MSVRARVRTNAERWSRLARANSLAMRAAVFGESDRPETETTSLPPTGFTSTIDCTRRPVQPGPSRRAARAAAVGVSTTLAAVSTSRVWSEDTRRSGNPGWYGVPSGTGVTRTVAEAL